MTDSVAPIELRAPLELEHSAPAGGCMVVSVFDAASLLGVHVQRLGSIGTRHR